MSLYQSIKKFAFACGILVFATSAFATENSTRHQFQNIIDHAQTQLKINSISLAVLMPDKKHPESFIIGTKSISDKTPINQGSIFKVGSIAKTYTATLVAKSIDEGKLKLSDKLGQFLPQYSKWKDITIGQLIDQTSGILDYILTPNWWRNLMLERGKIWTANELAQLAYDGQDDFVSGQGWEYSNTNYILLGMILQKIYHTPVQKLMTQLIQEVGLKHTYYYPKPYSQAIYSQMVHGYFRNQYDATKLNSSWLRTAGAILSTPADMVTWMNALFTSHSVKGLPISTHYNFVDTASGQPFNTKSTVGYSFGVFKRITPNGPIYFTPGLTSGYVSMMVYAPCYDTYFAYSGSKAPIPGFQDYMLSKVMSVLAHDTKLQTMLSKKVLPAYCRG
ncbi:MAG: serine hydrolase [Endozoicomonas sp. (ex Botrylloides leachii)]|nr:serine hydrolase [Endozoicomonas sp. (ex Botrylloides leachii)]